MSSTGVSVSVSTQIRNAEPMLLQCWPIVVDNGPTLKQLYVCVRFVMVARGIFVSHVNMACLAGITHNKAWLNGMRYPANTKHLYTICTMLDQRL